MEGAQYGWTPASRFLADLCDSRFSIIELTAGGKTSGTGHDCSLQKNVRPCAISTKLRGNRLQPLCA